MTEPQLLIRLCCRVTNLYVGGPRVVSDVEVQVPPPSSLDETDLDQWAEDHLFPLTGTGRTEGDAGYFVTVIDSPDLTNLAGLEWDWGI